MIINVEFVYFKAVKHIFIKRICEVVCTTAGS